MTLIKQNRFPKWFQKMRMKVNNFHRKPLPGKLIKEKFLVNSAQWI